MAPAVVRISAALIDDGQGRLLLVRKTGTASFMQAGGKIEDGETPFAALRRELEEELGLHVERSDAGYLGRFLARAANAPDHVVDAELFHVRVTFPVQATAEIEEAIWVDLSIAPDLDLAPLTREFVLPMARKLGAKVSL
ncbi:MAG: NUDIX hydrolase [Allosphingosinicella sp.]